MVCVPDRPVVVTYLDTTSRDAWVISPSVTQSDIYTRGETERMGRGTGQRDRQTGKQIHRHEKDR